MATKTTARLTAAVETYLVDLQRAEPKDLAWLLASHARDALAWVEAAGDAPALAAVRTALEEALGVRFEGERGARFFRSTLVQTLFYGVFSQNPANPVFCESGQAWDRYGMHGAETGLGLTVPKPCRAPHLTHARRLAQ